MVKSEVLGGNIVKEATARGQWLGLRIAKQVIEEHVATHNGSVK